MKARSRHWKRFQGWMCPKEIRSIEGLNICNILESGRCIWVLTSGWWWVCLLKVVQRGRFFSFLPSPSTLFLTLAVWFWTYSAQPLLPENSTASFLPSTPLHPHYRPPSARPQTHITPTHPASPSTPPPFTHHWHLGSQGGHSCRLSRSLSSSAVCSAL